MELKSMSFRGAWVATLIETKVWLFSKGFMIVGWETKEETNLGLLGVLGSTIGACWAQYHVMVATKVGLRERGDMWGLENQGLNSH